jgi:hypothetical protein
MKVVNLAFNAVVESNKDIGGLILYGGLILLGVATVVAAIVVVVTLVLRATSIGPS